MKYGIPAAAAIAMILSCAGDVASPASDIPEADAVAWFDGLGCSVDLYFPEDGQLLSGAFITGEAPNDIVPLPGRRFAVVNSLSSTVGVYDLDEPGEEIAEVHLPQGSNPYSACLCEGMLYVALLFPDSIAVIDTQGWTVESYAPVGCNPQAVAACPGLLFVGHADSYPDSAGAPCGVTVISLPSLAVVDTIPMPPNILGMRYFPRTGSIHAVSSTYADDGRITIIDPATLSVTATVVTGGTPGLPADLGDGFVCGDGWSSSALFFYDEDGTLEQATAPAPATGVEVYGDELYTSDFTGNRVFRLALPGCVPVDTLQAGSGPQGLAIIPR